MPSQNMTWVYDPFGPSTSFSLSPPSFFSVGNHVVQNWNVGLSRSLPYDLPREVAKDGLIMSIGPCGPSKPTVSVHVDYPSQTNSPLVELSEPQLDLNVLEPLAMDFSCLCNPSENCHVNDIWDGSNIYSENVSTWVASKMKSIAFCIGVAISGHEKEVAQLLSRIEKKNCVPKQASLRTAPAIRKKHLALTTPRDGLKFIVICLERW